MARSRRPGLLRRLAALMVRGPEAPFILSDLDDTMDRDLARGIPLWRARVRYVVNMVASAFNVWRNRWRRPNFGLSWLDLKLGLRMLAKNPGLSCVAVFALAIGIPVGLVPAHFINAVQAPLPFDEGDRILALRNLNLATSREEPASLYDFLTWREALTTFDALGAARSGAVNVNAEDGRAAPVNSAEVTASTFEILRVQPLIGRTLVQADEVAGAPNVVVIGHDLWQSRLGGDPDIVGQTIRIGRVPHTVVGVMPAEFVFPYRDQLWRPLRVTALSDEHTGERSPYSIYGRMSDGVSPEEAQAELTTISRRMSVELPDAHARLQAEAVPYAIGFFNLPRGGFQAMPEFYVVQIATLLLLVVACANVGMLVLARTATRSSELAVRTALGASRTRVISQLFTEALVFAVLAAGLGLLLADQISHGFVWMEEALPFWVSLAVTRETVFWALALAVFSAAAVSVVPALKVTGKAVQQNIQRAAARRSGVRFGGISSALIVTDVALAVATVGLALGLWSGFTKAQDGMGIQAEEYLSARFWIPPVESADGAAFDNAEFTARLAATQQELVRRLATEPGVRGVAMGSVLPGMDHPGRRIEIDGEHADDSENPRALYAYVGVDFFNALKQPLLAGRGFELSDFSGDHSVIIVNTNFVDRILGGRNPIGRRVRYTTSADEESGPWHEIVGVVGPLGMNKAMPGLDAGLYHPAAPGDIERLRLAVHVGDDPTAFTPRLRALAEEVDPTVIIGSDVSALDEVFSFSTFTIDWVKIGAGTLIAVLIALSVSGIYALMSFTVAQRSRELGIRSALGAQQKNIVLTIAKRAFAQLTLGVLLGMPIAGRFLFELHQASGTPMRSPGLVTVLIGLSVMVLIGILACTVPTLRALRIPPTEALRAG